MDWVVRVGWVVGCWVGGWLDRAGVDRVDGAGAGALPVTSSTRPPREPAKPKPAPLTCPPPSPAPRSRPPAPTPAPAQSGKDAKLVDWVTSIVTGRPYDKSVDCTASATPCKVIVRWRLAVQQPRRACLCQRSRFSAPAPAPAPNCFCKLLDATINTAPP